jgi:hypothetical protein
MSQMEETSGTFLTNKNIIVKYFIFNWTTELFSLDDSISLEGIYIHKFTNFGPTN